MKKLASLLLALLLVVSLPLFTSCNKSAYRTYVDAYEKTNALDSLDARMDIKTKMEMSGDSFEVPISYDIKATGIRTESPEFTAVMTFDARHGNGALIFIVTASISTSRGWVKRSR